MQRLERYLYLAIIMALIAIIIILLADGCNHKCMPCPEERIVFSDNQPSYTPEPKPLPAPTIKRQASPGTEVPNKKINSQAPVSKQQAAPHHTENTAHISATEAARQYTEQPQPQQPINTYADTIPLADQGRVVIYDTVQGIILKRAFSFSLLTPKPQTSATEKQRSRWYAGVDLQGAKSDPIQYLGLSFGLQPKNSKMLIFAGAGINRIGPVNGRPETSGRFGIYTQINRNR